VFIEIKLIAKKNRNCQNKIDTFLQLFHTVKTVKTKPTLGTLNADIFKIWYVKFNEKYIINQLKHITFLVYNTKIWKSGPNACSVSTLNSKGNHLQKEFL
jgi:hypothetical protein